MLESEVFDDLMDHWEERFALGQELTCEELCQNHPEFLEAARKYIRAMKAVGGGAARETVSGQQKPVQHRRTTPVEVPGYEILEELGRGGMGIVFRARQLSLKRFVALKMILREDLAGPDEIARFRGEAEALGQLQHPNIVQVYDVGASGGHPYFALELVEGGSLHQRLNGKPLPPRDAAGLVRTLSRAVHFAHDRGFIHRDLKPGNILLSELGEPKITDFGLAKRWNASGMALESPVRTASGEVIGTPAYMAPEQASGAVRETGPGADIYSLGAILYELLTGQLPFLGQSLLDILDQVVHSAPIPPRRIQPIIPRDLDTICLKCLEKSPSRRYLSANLLAEDLERYLNGVPILARPITLPIRFGRWCRRNPLLAITSITAILGLLTAVVVSVAFAIQSELDRVKLQAALVTSESHRKSAQRRLAENALDRGLAFCEQGEIVSGMWWLVRALEYAEEFEDLNSVIEANLTAWSTQLCTLERLLDHPQSVSALAVSPDNRLLAAAVPGETRIHLWSMTTGEPIALELKHGGQEITSLAFHPTQPILASGGKDRKIRIWKVRDSEVQLLLTLPTESVVDRLRYSQDGRWLGAKGELKLSLWDVENEYRPGKPVDLKAVDYVFDFTFVPHSSILMTADFVKQKIHLWDYAAGTASNPAINSLDKPLTLAASSDGRYFASAGLKELPTLYLSESRQRLTDIPGIPDHILNMAFHPNSPTLMMGKQSGSAVMWNALEARPEGSAMAHSSGVYLTQFTPDGLRAVTSGYDRTTRIWKLTSGAELKIYLHPKKEKVISAAISPDSGRLISVSQESTLTAERITLWDTQSGQAVGTPLYQFATKAQFDDTGRWVVLWGSKSPVRLWDVTTGKFSSFTPTHTNLGVSDVVFVPNSPRLITAGQDGTIRIWDRSQEKLALAELRHGETITRLLLNSQGTRLLSFGNQQGRKPNVKLWDVTRGECILDLDPLKIDLAAAFSPDGRWLATSGENGKIWIWDPVSGAHLGTLEGHASKITGLAFHPASRSLVSASEDGTVRHWNVEDKTLIGAFRHTREVGGVAFSPDGRTLLTHSLADASTRVWDVATFRQLGPAQRYSRVGTGHFQSQTFFAPDGKSYFMAGDSTVRQYATPASRNQGKDAWSNWLRTVTGQELDTSGVCRALGAGEWRQSLGFAARNAP